MKSIQKRTIVLVNTVHEDSYGEERQIKEDILAVEEPLEIMLGYGEVNHRQRKTIAVTMRTPDHDFELAVGFLYTEGVIFHKKDVKTVRFVAENRVLVDLDETVNVDLGSLNRHFYTTSSCGVCGKASLEAVAKTIYFILEKDVPKIPQNTIFGLPDKLLAVQQYFNETGGVHASVLFDTVQGTPYGDGRVLKAFEDVGRHNALDKLIGWAFQQDILPLKDKILVVSGRASFELIQKAAMAGIPIVAAVGAPSSLAVDLAEENGMTLIGFLKNNKFNVYTGIERLS
jgi:FdhD protein